MAKSGPLNAGAQKEFAYESLFGSVVHCHVDQIAMKIVDWSTQSHTHTYALQWDSGKYAK